MDESTPEDTGSVLIPAVPFIEQAKIGQLLLSVYSLRDKANGLEDEAIAELEAVVTG